MRLYFSFGYNIKKLGLSVCIGEEEKSDLIRYGYDVAPKLIYIKVHLLFIELIVGNLLMQ